MIIFAGNSIIIIIIIFIVLLLLYVGQYCESKSVCCLSVDVVDKSFVETSVNVISNSPSQDYTHPDDRTSLNYDMTPGFKPFTILLLL